MTIELWDGLAEALGYCPTHTLGDVVKAIEAGQAQLHHAEGAAIVTELVPYPRMKVVNFWLAAGEKDRVVALSRDVLSWAKREGCERAVFTGRRGWERVLSSEGWTRELTQMGREV